MEKFENSKNYKDKTLYTPGPVTTSKNVKFAMIRDIGSRDVEFTDLISDIRKALLAVTELDKETYDIVLLQGSGTYGLESVITSTVPGSGKILIIIKILVWWRLNIWKLYKEVMNN